MDIKLFKNKKNISEPRMHINPDKYWHIIFSMALLVVILGLVFGYYLFNKVNAEFSVLETETGVKTEMIKQERLKATLKYFAEKEARSMEILNNPALVVDPSH